MLIARPPSQDSVIAGGLAVLIIRCYLTYMTLKFPNGFLWGASTSSYQVEGGINNSDWSSPFPSGKACDHYSKYEDDFDFARELGQNAHRFSVEWSRVEPKEGFFDEKEIAHYKNVLLALKKRGIKTMLTLHHFTSPDWFSQNGGWANSKNVFYFCRYAEKMIKELGDLVGFWITINEPMVHLSAGYLSKRWPPFKRSPILFLKAFSNMIVAHRTVFNNFHKINPNVKVGIAKNNQFFEPSRNNIFLDKISVFVARFLSNRLFLEKIKNHFDFLGINYYFHRKVRFPFRITGDGKLLSDLGWEIFPKGIYGVIAEASRYRRPIYITENGLADEKDEKREGFIRDHLTWIHKAIKDGFDVRGYFHWSLMDNFEWDKGFKPRFGLLEIDYNSLDRKIRPSARYYADVCKNNAI